jgi:hypothetical protein
MISRRPKEQALGPIPPQSRDRISVHPGPDGGRVQRSTLRRPSPVLGSIGVGSVDAEATPLRRLVPGVKGPNDRL